MGGDRASDVVRQGFDLKDASMLISFQSTLIDSSWILTQSTASLVVACSSTILSLGKSPASFRRCDKKCFSAFNTEMFYKPLRHV
jgi:hypothetical protein